MQLPFFYKEQIDISSAITLDEATSKHIGQVLRMRNGEQIQLTDGKGNLYTCNITDNNRKKCTVTVLHKSEIANLKSKITIAISLLKNSSRLEWFLEKATELGVSTIVPLICERTEKQSFKMERMQGILISAMLQSRQCWLPELNEPVKFENYAIRKFENTGKFIAHCENDQTKKQLHTELSTFNSQLILIGPEGDFTRREIELALQNNFIAVALGDTRLRTETAGIVAATLLCTKSN